MLKLTPIAFLPLVASCSIFDPLVRYQVGSARHNYEAASPHVSMVALFPWNDIKKHLKPHFTLDGEKALELSRSLNALYDEQVSRAYSLQIAAQLLGTLDPSKAQAAPGAAAPPPVGQAAPGAVPTPPVGQAAPGAAPAPPGNKAAPPANDETPLAKAIADLAGNRSTIGIESGLNYRLAAGLLDLVMILNESIKHVPRIEGYSQYLLVTQVSVIPRKRNLPFDVYTDLAFFPGPGEPARPPPYRQGDDATIEDPAPLPEVFTLLPTNTMELAQEQRTRRLAADLSLGGSGTLGSVGLSGSGGTRQEQRDQALALDYNGIFSAERIATNVVRAAVGARQTAGGDYEMIASSSLVATYILVPNWYKRLDVYTEQTLVNPLSGKPLGRGVPASIYDSDLADLVENHELKWQDNKNVDNKGIKVCDIGKDAPSSAPGKAVAFFKKKLNDLVLRGEYEEFLKFVRICLRPAKEPMPREEYQPLWLDAVRIVANLPRSFFRVQIKQ